MQKEIQEKNRAREARLEEKLQHYEQLLEMYREKEYNYRMIIEHASDIFYRADQRGYFCFVNESAARITGYSTAELLTMHYTQLIREDYRETAVNFYVKQWTNGVASTYFEFPIITKAGKEVWVGQNVQFLKNELGEREFTAVVRDITKSKKSEEALRRSEEKYRSVIENMGMGMLEVDIDGTITWANMRLCELSGYSLEELQGKNAVSLLIDSESLRIVDEQARLRKKGASGVYEVKIRKKDGTGAWMLISGRPLLDEQGTVTGSLGIYLDITGQKNTEYSLREAKIKAESSARAKELFLANMSHEIRTPMNAIIGMASLLEAGSDNSEQQKYVEVIRVSATNLLAIINDILDFSKIESGKFTLEENDFELDRLIDLMVHSLEFKTKEKSIALQYFVDPEIPRVLRGDRLRLNQVLLNLLNNAVKFTHRGSVSVSCRLVTMYENSCRIRFSVEDTGIGIAPENVAKIFDSFTQENEKISGAYGGTGLGLAICKQLIELMGGEIRVESRKDEGSCFSFELQMEKGEALPEEKKPSLPVWQENYAKGKNILLVEDNRINQFLAKTMLQRWEANTDIAGSGEEAIELLKKNKYDLILMDIQMPGMGGIAATQVIRTELRLRTPIIALTANAIKGDREKYLAAGMNNYLSKPFEQNELQRTLNEYLQPSIFTRQGNTSAPLYSLDRLNEMAEGDTSFVDKMIALYLEQMPIILADLEKASREKDLQEIAAVAHKVKSSAQVLGMMGVLKNSRQVEELAREGKETDLVVVLAGKIAAEIKKVLTALEKEVKK